MGALRASIEDLYLRDLLWKGVWVKCPHNPARRDMISLLCGCMTVCYVEDSIGIRISFSEASCKISLGSLSSLVSLGSLGSLDSLGSFDVS